MPDDRMKPREFWVVVGGARQALYVHWGEYRRAQVLRWAGGEFPRATNLEAVFVRELAEEKHEIRNRVRRRSKKKL